jgi:hypothetical protein
MCDSPGLELLTVSKGHIKKAHFLLENFEGSFAFEHKDRQGTKAIVSN